MRYFVIVLFFLCISLNVSALDGTVSPQLQHKGMKYEKGTIVPYSYYLSPGARADSCAVYVLLELDVNFSSVLEPLFKEKVIPEGIVLYVYPGTLYSTMSGNPEQKRWLRAEEFDQNGPEFVNLIVEEILPSAAAEAGIVVSRNPDRHFIHGGSSGGYLTWNALWYRNDFFHRGFLSSPTFSAMRGGEEPMVLVRKTEPRPIRAYITSGTIEPDYFFGDSYYVACNAADALHYAGYDVEFELYAQGTHCFNRYDAETWRKVMKWVFEPEKVVVPRRSVRFSSLVPDGSVWQDAGLVNLPIHTVSRNSRAVYEMKRGKLKIKSLVNRKTQVLDLDNVSSIAFSSDLWRLYVADVSRRFIYAYSLDSFGLPVSKYALAPLHLPHDCRNIGGKDLCVSSDDRVFVATELGVQSICSFGLTDIILPLPQDAPADAVWLADGWLYARSVDGKVYKRTVKTTAHDGKTSSTPSEQNYADGFDYSRPHLENEFNRYQKGEVLKAY